MNADTPITIVDPLGHEDDIRCTFSEFCAANEPDAVAAVLDASAAGKTSILLGFSRVEW